MCHEVGEYFVKLFFIVILTSRGDVLLHCDGSGGCVVICVLFRFCLHL